MSTEESESKEEKEIPRENSFMEKKNKNVGCFEEYEYVEENKKTKEQLTPLEQAKRYLAKKDCGESSSSSDEETLITALGGLTIKEDEFTDSEPRNFEKKDGEDSGVIQSDTVVKRNSNTNETESKGDHAGNQNGEESGLELNQSEVNVETHQEKPYSTYPMDRNYNPSKAEGDTELLDRNEFSEGDEGGRNEGNSLPEDYDSNNESGWETEEELSEETILAHSYKSKEQDTQDCVTATSVEADQEASNHVPEVKMKVDRNFRFSPRPGLKRVSRPADRNPILDAFESLGFFTVPVARSLRPVPQRLAGNPITGEGYDVAVGIPSLQTNKRANTPGGNINNYPAVSSIPEIGSNSPDYVVTPPSFKNKIARKVVDTNSPIGNNTGKVVLHEEETSCSTDSMAKTVQAKQKVLCKEDVKLGKTNKATMTPNEPAGDNMAETVQAKSKVLCKEDVKWGKTNTAATSHNETAGVLLSKQHPKDKAKVATTPVLSNQIVKKKQTVPDNMAETVQSKTKVLCKEDVQLGKTNKATMTPNEPAGVLLSKQHPKDKAKVATTPVLSKQIVKKKQIVTDNMAKTNQANTQVLCKEDVKWGKTNTAATSHNETAGVPQPKQEPKDKAKAVKTSLLTKLIMKKKQAAIDNMAKTDQANRELLCKEDVDIGKANRASLTHDEVAGDNMAKTDQANTHVLCKEDVEWSKTNKATITDKKAPGAAESQGSDGSGYALHRAEQHSNFAVGMVADVNPPRGPLQRSVFTIDGQGNSPGDLMQRRSTRQSQFDDELLPKEKHRSPQPDGPSIKENPQDN